MLNHLGARGPVPMIGGGASPVPADVAPTTDLVPLNGHLFVLPTKAPEKVGELYVPPTSSTSCSGVVIASGSELAAPGDTVVFTGLYPFEFEGKTHVAVAERHLVGVKKKGGGQSRDEFHANGHHATDGESCRCGAPRGDAAARVACPLAGTIAANAWNIEGSSIPIPAPDDRSWMKLWKSHKNVRAARITGVMNAAGGERMPRPWLSLDCGVTISVSATWYEKHNPEEGGYFVAYEDGYTSYSPAGPFEQGYDQQPASPNSTRAE